jgi:glycosyltransferase involved in cell wall biosynthesis
VLLFRIAIVATNTGGPLEILEHGRTGLLFTPKDVCRKLKKYLRIK